MKAREYRKKGRKNMSRRMTEDFSQTPGKLAEGDPGGALEKMPAGDSGEVPESELVQPKLNIESSVTKVSSGEFRRSRLSQNDGEGSGEELEGGSGEEFGAGPGRGRGGNPGEDDEAGEPRKAAEVRRRVSLERRTKETYIKVKLDLDGRGEAEVRTGIGFFDHMLTAWSRFAGIDLQLEAEGDLEVDPHHTIEDCGIVLAQALRAALSDKRGLERFGEALLPMDESLVQVALDISNRPYLVWDVNCPSAAVGGFPTEMAEEFFRALVQAGLTLHIRLLSGKNSHHILEAVFKGVGRVLRQAVRKSSEDAGVFSTKGVL
ncbi:imidazoleglycerol-phosphate dehydratase [Acididesulfobacillus acetoxydans]|uniref:Imidazoleglycerol-phosphate dehydratase n=1 Tax=Acididesulfobacillus acetoxydans TaxID=1561005 RepID=A0A8S0W4G6_9FIRM|nr:imidazoleglycerol-phosphate dehydratase [Acididesulfobacillus acetoxydans]CEJ08357.1 Imidazoleglycerol-phosphate dehydratase [Acididesulfobacillus acetoxydans]